MVSTSCLEISGTSKILNEDRYSLSELMVVIFTLSNFLNNPFGKENMSLSLLSSTNEGIYERGDGDI